MKKLTLFMSLLLVLGCSAKSDVFNTRYSGTLELTEHVLGPKVAGRITTLTVKEGDLVKVSQVISTLDRYEQAKKDYERTVELLKIGGTTPQTLEYAKLSMEDQQIVAPIDGVVLVKTSEVGEIIPAGAGVVVIGDPKDQWVKIYLSEGLVSQIRIGQKATVVFDGSNKIYEGHISFIATKAQFTPRNVQTPEERVTQTFAVKISLDNPDEYVHAGVAADVTFKR
ncbi:MAG: HlyD family efflux transporter periplasmic adaptor subunit [Candidatus Omnitrophota bacterium]